MYVLYIVRGVMREREAARESGNYIISDQLRDKLSTM